ncbi:MAG: hypothetical protein ABS920_02020 [Sporosarcina sp.]
MIRDMLRILGTACILSGGILYFINEKEYIPVSEKRQLQAEVEELSGELAKTKELLATAQTISTVKEHEPAAEEKKMDSKKDVTESNSSDKDTTIRTILLIEAGSNSAIVSADLERMGIVEDAAIFDAFLADNGLTGQIQIGEHKIDSSMDFHAIAKEITSVK